jgi:hypothetical protein
MFRFRKIKDFFLDVRNYLYLRSVIKKNIGTADWDRFNLKVDYVSRIYTVFNPLPADKGDDAETLKIKLGERMIPCHKYIDTIGLSEVVAVSGEQIPESNSYLVVYYPIFKYITTWRMFVNAIYLITLFLLRHRIYDGFLWFKHLFIH